MAVEDMSFVPTPNGCVRHIPPVQDYEYQGHRIPVDTALFRRASDNYLHWLVLGPSIESLCGWDWGWCSTEDIRDWLSEESSFRELVHTVSWATAWPVASCFAKSCCSTAYCSRVFIVWFTLSWSSCCAVPMLKTRAKRRFKLSRMCSQHSSWWRSEHSCSDIASSMKIVCAEGSGGAMMDWLEADQRWSGIAGSISSLRYEGYQDGQTNCISQIKANWISESRHEMRPEPSEKQRSALNREESPTPTLPPSRPRILPPTLPESWSTVACAAKINPPPSSLPNPHNSCRQDQDDRGYVTSWLPAITPLAAANVLATWARTTRSRYEECDISFTCEIVHLPYGRLAFKHSHQHCT